jgi:glutamate--cysteine ligase
MMAFAFEDGFGYEQYVDWVLDVPMYFVKRGDIYHDVAGLSFRDLLAGKLAPLPGELATISDWANHISTVFPEVRLKRYLEMRGADVGPANMIAALSAFWVGLLYDSASLDGAWDLVKGWTTEERQQLRDDVPRLALKAHIKGRSVQEIAKDVLALAAAGLKNRARLDAQGQNEVSFLDPLFTIADSGETQAEALLALYHGEWHQSIDPIFKECVF